MEGRTITRADLSELVFQEVGLSRNEFSDLVETILAEVVEALARGELVKISSFGSFTVETKASVLAEIRRRDRKCRSCPAASLSSERRTS